MSFEIERKFLVRGHDWQKLATTKIPIRQAYLASNGKTSIRIRIKGDSATTLTIKSRPVPSSSAGWSWSMIFRCWRQRHSCSSGKARSSRR
jgi:CYTH domain-containing protein